MLKKENNGLNFYWLENSRHPPPHPDPHETLPYKYYLIIIYYSLCPEMCCKNFENEFVAYQNLVTMLWHRRVTS